jgi:hypothetical protein
MGSSRPEKRQNTELKGYSSDYSVDSTTIDLCQKMYPWAKFLSKKGTVKLHLRLDHDEYLPDFGIITDGKCHDVKAIWEMPFPADSITVFDRAYVDFSLFEHIATNKAWFVTFKHY